MRRSGLIPDQPGLPRYRSFFDATDGQLDGTWALEDADCAYLLLNEPLYAEETSNVARLLIEDFKQ